MRVLVIDDSRAMRMILGGMLKRAGMEVAEAGTGREALECLQQLGDVGLALVDWNMPEMSGIEFVRAVRADDRFAQLPLIMVTTETEMAQVSHALEEGANDYVMKPFTKEVILEKLDLLGVTPRYLMGKTRVLVVDDAVVVRRLVSETLAGDPALEVVGCAANGRIALAKIPQVNPDLVTLDVEMPEMDGLETLAALRKTHPRLPVIMFSALTHRGAAATFHALTLGATDYVAKPANMTNLTLAVQYIREELIPRIKQLGGQTAEAARLHPPLAATRTRLPATPVRARDACVEIVTVGVSTGGPNALAVLLAALPAQFLVPMVIVQHMPAMFTRLLAERLAAVSALGVHEGTPGAVLERGQAWLAPGDYHMVLSEDARGCRLRLHQGPLENSCRPSVDVLFRSVAETYGPATLAVVLTGMGQDGLRGCERVREAGGHVLVQDEATSVVWGMPGFVARAGLADEVLPLSQLAPAILNRVQRGRSRLLQPSGSFRGPDGGRPPGPQPG